MNDIEHTKSGKTFDRIKTKIKTASSTIVRLFAELAVVFIGVYLAFLLTDYQEELEKGEIRIKFYESLIVELSGVVQHLLEEEEHMLWHTSTREEIRKGNRPKIPAQPLNCAIPASLLTAAFDSRNFESLKTPTINNVVLLTPVIESLNQKVQNFNNLLVSLLAAQKSDEDCCYDIHGNILDDYIWYPTLVKDIHDLNVEIREIILDRAIPDLQQLTKS
ncbi:MAG: hypothetical protein F4077_00495 [Gammaproteobacteria bacterium]|nr:hypothetical protein [Gammaproteobacteria bacterium]MYI76237.1 hypothetical protein [Gammaproteobacteria bacterium]